VITADTQEKVILVSRAAETIPGNMENEMVGKTLEDMFLLLAPSSHPHLDRVLNNDQAVLGLEISPNLPERGMVDLRFNLSPLKDASQLTQGVAIVVDD
jgi:PAS domain-containing protein